MTDWGGLPLRTRTPRRTFPLRRAPPPRCHRASRASRLRLRRLLDDPAVAVLLQVPGQVRVAALHDSAVHEYVDEVGDHVVEETLVVGHDEHRSVRAAHRIHSICDKAQGVDVSPESVSSRMQNFGSRTAIWKTSFFFFSPPEKPSFSPRFMKVSSRPRSFALSCTRPMKSIASISSSPRYFRIAFRAAFRK